MIKNTITSTAFPEAETVVGSIKNFLTGKL